jgi:hypothetical protein
VPLALRFTARLTAGITAALLLLSGSPASAALPAGNLLVNPGAEEGPAADDETTPSPPDFPWAPTEGFAQVHYGVSTFPSAALSASIGGGSAFFAGGRISVSTAVQEMNVSGAAPEIDAGGIVVILSGHLGGYLTQTDAAKVEVEFVDGFGALQGPTAVIGPVTALDRQDETTLLPRDTAVSVPLGTRKLRLRVTATRGPNGVYNDGYADKLNVSLSADATPPSTQIVLDPEDPTPGGAYLDSVNVTVSAADAAGGSGVAETRCVLDPSSAPASFDDLPPICPFLGTGSTVMTLGSHLVYAASRDFAGQKEAPVIRAFRISTPPSASITGGPSGPTRDATPGFTFESSQAGSAFTCRVDNEAATACTSPWDAPSLTDGPHTLVLEATNVDGLTDATPPERSFVVDTANPVTQIVLDPASAPAGGAYADSVGVTVSAQDGAAGTGVSQTRCVLDPPSAPGTFDALPASCPYLLGGAVTTRGSHVLYAASRDVAGNDGAPVAREFVIASDADTPETFLDSGPRGLTNVPAPVFGFHSEATGARFECRVDAAPFAACTSPHTTAALGDGVHRFQVRAAAGGRTDPSPAEATFTVDASPPVVTITAGPKEGETIGDVPPEFEFSSDPGATFSCRTTGPRIKDAQFVACRGSYRRQELLALGERQAFEVRAVDPSDNAGPVTTRRYVKHGDSGEKPEPSECVDIAVTTTHGPRLTPRCRLAKISRGKVPCLSLDTGKPTRCRFKRTSGNWVEARQGNFAVAGQRLSLTGKKKGNYVVATKVDRHGDAPCVKPPRRRAMVSDTAGRVSPGFELNDDCVVEEILAPWNAAGHPLRNWTEDEVCSADPSHPDGAAPTGSPEPGVFCYSGPGVALNDTNGLERDQHLDYMRTTREPWIAYGYLADVRYVPCHLIVNGGFEVPGAKRPATFSMPAPGRVNKKSKILWRPVNPNVTIANG